MGVCHQAGGRWPSGPETCSSLVGAPGSGRWRPDRHRDLPPTICDLWEPCWLSRAALLPRPSLQLSSEPVRGRWSLRHPNTHVFRPKWPWGPLCLSLQQGVGAGGTDVQKGKLSPRWLRMAGALGPSLAAWLPRAMTLTPRSSLAGLWCGPHRAQRQASRWSRGQVGDGGENRRSVCPVPRPLPWGHAQALPQGGRCTPSPSHCQPVVPGGPCPENAVPGHRSLGSVCPEPQQGQDEDQSWGRPALARQDPLPRGERSQGGFLTPCVSSRRIWEAQAGSLMGSIPDDRDHSEISIGQNSPYPLVNAAKAPQRASLSYGRGGCLL